MLEEAAVRPTSGGYCLSFEAQTCAWSERRFHPDDLKTCALVGLTVHFSLLSEFNPPRLKPLVEMLNGNRMSADGTQLWNEATAKLSEIRKSGKLQIEAASFSPSGHLLALSCGENTARPSNKPNRCRIRSTTPGFCRENRGRQAQGFQVDINLDVRAAMRTFPRAKMIQNKASKAARTFRSTNRGALSGTSRFSFQIILLPHLLPSSAAPSPHLGANPMLSTN